MTLIHHSTGLACGVEMKRHRKVSLLKQEVQQSERCHKRDSPSHIFFSLLSTLLSPSLFFIP
jgi:hypothetical protein